MTFRSSPSPAQRPSHDNVAKAHVPQPERRTTRNPFSSWLGGRPVGPRERPGASKAAQTPFSEGLGPGAELGAGGGRPVGGRTKNEERGAEEEGREPKAEAKGGENEKGGESEMLDPMQRILWHEGGWARPEGARPAMGAPAAPVPGLDALVDRFLRRVAFSGGKQRGVAHLEIGSGELAGGSLTISAEGEGVELVLDAPPGVDPEPYRALLSKRLAAKGVKAEVRVR